MLQTIRSEVERLKNTLTWSIEGVLYGWREEKSFRQWCGVNVISCICLALSSFSTLEAVVLVALGVLTLIMELVNSAIEATVDYISEERHPLAKKAKDLGSSAVFVAALLWGFAWLVLAFG